MNKITITTSIEFHKFILYAVQNGLRYTADEHDGVYVVIVTGY